MSKHKNQRTARTLEKTWDTLNHLIVISSCLYRLNLKSIAQIALSVLAMIISTSLIIAAIIFIISANHKVTLTTVTVQTIKNHTEKNITTYLTQVPPERVSSSKQPTTTSPIHTDSATTSPNTKSETHHTTAQTKGRTTTSTQTNKPSTKPRPKNPPKKPKDDYHLKCSTSFPVVYVATINSANPSVKQYQATNQRKNQPSNPQTNQPPKPQTKETQKHQPKRRKKKLPPTQQKNQPSRPQKETPAPHNPLCSTQPHQNTQSNSNPTTQPPPKTHPIPHKHPQHPSPLHQIPPKIPNHMLSYSKTTS